MFPLLKIALLLLTTLNLVNCNGQAPDKQYNKLSNDFDKSLPFYYHMPKKLSANDTSPGYKQHGQKILLTGTVYATDGKTPVPDVILYYYHTNSEGVYATKESEQRNMPKNKLGQTHGYIRGWLKTDKHGKYSIYTVKPETYPRRDEPAHVHISLKDNNMKEPYYIDDFVFDDDPRLTSRRRIEMENRGGSGVIRFVRKGSLLIGERNIILGLNIPNYPKKKEDQLHSGKHIGEDMISFTPFHAYGPDKGTKTCPICKYGWFHGILYFVGDNPNWEDIRQWLVFLDQESEQRQTYLKVYFVYGNSSNYNKDIRMQELETLGTQLELNTIALTFVPSFTDKNSDIHLNEINPKVENTFLLFKRSNIIDKYINFKPTQENFKIIKQRLDETANDYFKLSKAKQK